MNIDKKLKQMLGKNKSNSFNFKNFGLKSFGGRNNNMMKNFRLKSFGGKNDLDFDGVPNWKDCQPRNVMRQDLFDVVENVMMSPEEALGKLKEGTKTAREEKIKQFEVVKQRPVEITTTPEQMHRVIVTQREIANPREHKIHIAISMLGEDEYNLRQQIAHQKFGKDWIDLSYKEKDDIRKERIDRYGYYKPIE